MRIQGQLENRNVTLLCYSILFGNKSAFESEIVTT